MYVDHMFYSNVNCQQPNCVNSCILKIKNKVKVEHVQPCFNIKYSTIKQVINCMQYDEIVCMKLAKYIDIKYNVHYT